RASSHPVLLGAAATAAALPALALARVFDGPAAAAIAGACAVLLAGAALATGGRGSIPQACRNVWLAAGAVMIAVAAGYAASAAVAAPILFVAALAAASTARFTGTLRRPMLIVATAFA